MYFESPDWLWLLWLALIPVIIHLFQFRRPKVLVFSSIQFIKQLDTTSKNRRKLKHLLVMISRMFFIIFLVLMLAGPKTKSASTDIRDFMIVIDNSLSMTNEVESGLTLLDDVIGDISKSIRKARFSDRFQVYSLDVDQPVQSWGSKFDALDILTDIDPTYQFLNLQELLAKVTDQSKPFQLIYVTDFQRSNHAYWQNLTIPDQVELLSLVLAQRGNLENVYIDSAYLTLPYILPNEPIELNIVFKNDGRQSRTINVQYLVNDRQAGNKQIELLPDESKLEKFTIQPVSDRFIRFQVAIEDYPVTFDNDFFISLPAYRRPKIFHIYEGKANIYLKALFENSPYFEYIPNEITALNYDALPSADFIILDALRHIPDVFYKIPSTVSFFLIPADKDPDMGSYQDFIGMNLSTIDDKQPVNLEINPLRIGFFEGIFESSGRITDLPTAKFTMGHSQPTDVILRDAFARAYLYKTTVNRRIFVINSPLLPSFTNLPTHGLFLPLMFRMVQSSMEQKTAIYLREDPATVSLPASQATGNIQVHGAGFSYLPTQRTLAGKVLIDIPAEQLQPGFFYLSNEQDTLSSFAINIGKAESQLASLSLEELEDQLAISNPVTVLNYQPDITFRSVIEEGQAEMPLWKYALVLAILFLLIEVLILRLIK